MYEISETQHISYDGKIERVRVVIMADKFSDVPGKDDIDGLSLAVGSIAWAIKDKDWYGLSSDGVWVNQDKDAEESSSAKTMLMSSLMAKPTSTLDVSLDTEENYADEDVLSEQSIETVTVNVSDLLNTAAPADFLGTTGAVTAPATDLFEGVFSDEDVRGIESGEDGALS